MRLNKDQQYAMLFTLYLCRAGRVSVPVVAKNLGLSSALLHQVARKLKEGPQPSVKSVRGPSGGYELIGSPSVEEILYPFTPVFLLNENEGMKYVRGISEERAFFHFCRNLHAAMSPILKRKIHSLNNELTANELGLLNRTDISNTAH